MSYVRPTDQQRLLDIPVSGEDEYRDYRSIFLREKENRLPNLPCVEDSRISKIRQQITSLDAYLSSYLLDRKNPYFDLPPNTLSDGAPGLDNYLLQAVQTQNIGRLNFVLLARYAYYIDREVVCEAYNNAVRLSYFNMANSIAKRYGILN